MSQPDRSGAKSVRSRSHARRLEFSVEWPPGHAAAYLLPREEPILVDAGMTGEAGAEELVDGLEAHGYRPADVEHLLLTHAHSDHVGQTRTLLEASDGEVTVYAPRRIRSFLRRDPETVEAATRENMREAGVPDEHLEEGVERLVDAHRRMREALPLEAVDVWIDEGESIRVGDLEVEPIYTPGHHLTHFCYGTTLEADDGTSGPDDAHERVLFSGDMVIEPFRAAAIHANFDEGVAAGISAFLEALERFDAGSYDRVYPGHGPVHDRFEESVERSFADLDERVRGSYDALRADGSTAFHVAAELSDRPSHRARILPEIVGALAHLEREGEVCSRLEDGVRFYEPV
ncbi:MBL fold metallo-hydrolase [Natrialbaceae archaeon GCM10025810]|uniref:MBL fold metallo-hydrolase n=1 Tax=Halovalidus salilacus TaxID=3075124 RepID=UPI00360E66AE